MKFKGTNVDQHFGLKGSKKKNKLPEPIERELTADEVTGPWFSLVINILRRQTELGCSRVIWARGLKEKSGIVRVPSKSRRAGKPLFVIDSRRRMY